MDHEIVALAESELEPAARALTLAFNDDPMQVYVYPDLEERMRKAPVQFGALLRFGRMFGETYTTAGNPSGAIIAQPPGANVTPERAVASGMDRLPVAIGGDAFQRLGMILDHLETNHRSGVPEGHWYVMVVGVVPAQQGRGIGRALLEQVIARAGAAGLPCLLDTAQPDNVAFYEHMGFKVIHDSVDPISGLRFWTFLR